MNTDPVIVLAGGFGTRLKSVVADVPKPLAPVHGKAFLHYLLDDLIADGARQIYLSLHHMAEQVEAFAEKYQEGSSISELELKCIREDQPLGTGGAIRHVIRTANLSSSVCVCNGDTYLPGAYAMLHSASDLPAIAVVRVANASRYGQVELNDAGVIQKFREKESEAQAGWINAGTYRLQPNSLGEVEADSFSLEQLVFPDLVKRGELRGVPIDGEFIDIGIPEDYERFQGMVAPRS